MGDLNTEFNRRLTKAFHEENEQEQDFIETVLSKIEKLEQENERLREALKKIMDRNQYIDGISYGIAEKALKE